MKETMLANNKIGSLIILKSSFPTRFSMRSLSGLRSLLCQKLSQLCYLNGAEIAHVPAA